MEKSEFFELIESYLENTLSDEKRKEVEQRLAMDEDFRREVGLHRELQQTFSDPGRWKLRSALTEIIKVPVLAEDPAHETKHPLLKNQWKWVLFPVIILATVGIWYWLKPSNLDSPKEPIEVQPPAPAEGMGADTLRIGTPKETITPKQSPEKNLQFAEVDPKNFVPNSSMEALVNSSSRSISDLALTVTSPVNSASFITNTKGETMIRFAGQLTGSSGDSPIYLDLNIFNNRDVNIPLFSKSLRVKQASDVSSFDTRQRLKFPSGLYYFAIGQDGEIVYVGKFTVGKLKK